MTIQTSTAGATAAHAAQEYNRIEAAREKTAIREMFRRLAASPYLRPSAEDSALLARLMAEGVSPLLRTSLMPRPLSQNDVSVIVQAIHDQEQNRRQLRVYEDQAAAMRPHAVIEAEFGVADAELRRKSEELKARRDALSTELNERRSVDQTVRAYEGICSRLPALPGGIIID